MRNRRWFFTATGSAFLAAACGVVGQVGSTAGRGPLTTEPSGTAGADEEFEELLSEFYRGCELQLADFASILPEDQLPRDREELRRRFEETLISTYRERFRLRMEKGDLKPEKRPLRKDQACVLGQLTILAFRHEVGGVADPGPFERPDPVPRLGLKHLQWARETYGFYTNTKIKPRHQIQICGEPPPTSGDPCRQINEPCPLCFA